MRFAADPGPEGIGTVRYPRDVAREGRAVDLATYRETAVSSGLTPEAADDEILAGLPALQRVRGASFQQGNQPCAKS